MQIQLCLSFCQSGSKPEGLKTLVERERERKKVGYELNVVNNCMQDI